jgi:hypothetical protein
MSFPPVSLLAFCVVVFPSGLSMGHVTWKSRLASVLLDLFEGRTSRIRSQGFPFSHPKPFRFSAIESLAAL